MDTARRRILLAYVDESGKPHQLREGPFVVAAAVVSAEELERTENEIRDFLQEWEKKLKKHHPRMNIPPLEEIHARAVVMGEGFWRGIRPSLRNEFILDASRLIRRLPIVLNIVVLRMEPGAPLNPRRVRFEVHKRLIERIVMTDPRAAEIIIKYDSTGLDNHSIAAELLQGLREGYVQYHGRISIGFIDSRDAPLIQVADLAAYVVRMTTMERYLVRQVEIDKAFLNIEPKLRRCPHSSDYRGCGLKETILCRNGRIK